MRNQQCCLLLLFINLFSVLQAQIPALQEQVGRKQYAAVVAYVK